MNVIWLNACSLISSYAKGGEMQQRSRPFSRCWGIGLGRTGTTSLCEAFSTLGYRRVMHNPPFEALQTADAGADNGVTIFYKYLDYIHPGSKFILTRDCRGDVDAGLVGVTGGAALRREREPGLCVAQALSRRVNRTGRASTDAGDGNAGPAHRARAGARG